MTSQFWPVSPRPRVDARPLCVPVLHHVRLVPGGEGLVEDGAEVPQGEVGAGEVLEVLLGASRNYCTVQDGLQAYMGTGGERGGHPLLKGQSPSPPPPVREKNFQGLVQNPLKMAEKGFKM